jgi:hypothetical protein
VKFENELRINAWAVHIQQLWKREIDPMNALRPTREDLDAFETTYNAACASLARGDLRESELLLRRSAGLFSFSRSVLELVKFISWANESPKRHLHDVGLPARGSESYRDTSNSDSATLRTNPTRQMG